MHAFSRLNAWLTAVVVAQEKEKEKERRRRKDRELDKKRQKQNLANFCPDFTSYCRSYQCAYICPYFCAYKFSNFCTDCAAGQYRAQNDTVFSGCKLCAAGQYVNVSGQSSCDPCPVGRKAGDGRGVWRQCWNLVSVAPTFATKTGLYWFHNWFHHQDWFQCTRHPDWFHSWFQCAR